MVKIPEVIDGVISDLAPIPTGTALSVLGQYRKRQVEAARDLFYEEVKSGHVPITETASEEDFIRSIYRYLRAASEGAGRVNLRLLAKVIAGRLRAGTLVADEFLAQANALETLSRDEIIFIGSMYKVHIEMEVEGLSDQKKAPWARAQKMLCPDFFTTDELQAIGARSQRSGFILAISGFSQGRMGFKLSPSFFGLTEMVDFLDALRKEGIKFP